MSSYANLMIVVLAGFTFFFFLTQIMAAGFAFLPGSNANSEIIMLTPMCVMCHGI